MLSVSISCLVLLGKHWLQNIAFSCHGFSIIHSCMALHYMYM